MGAEGDSLLLAGTAQALLAALRVGAPVGADVERRRVALAGQGQRLGDRIAAANVEPPPGSSQRLAEVAQRLEQEGDPVGGGEARLEQRRVEDEERHRSLGPRRRRESRVVPHSQVAVEEDDRCAHFPYGAGMEERPSGRDESESERLDRNLSELLQELRVALPGVQVLFAFLLAVPFQQNFTKINGFEKDVYFFTLLCTAISAILLIAPSSYHRVTFRLQQKRELIRLANRFTIAGLAFLAMAMTGAIVLITDVLFGGIVTVITGAGTVAAFAAFWYVLPLRRRLSLTGSARP